MQINFGGGIDPRLQMASQICAAHPGCVDCELDNEHGVNGLICETAVSRIRMGEKWAKE